MICPRCGRSTPGNVCPYCDGPQIEDYTQDYIKRKKEYESFSEISEDHTEEIPKEEDKKQVSSRKFVIPVVIAAAAAIASMIVINAIRDYRPAPEYNKDAFYALNGKYYRLNGTEVQEAGDAKTTFFSGDGTGVYRSDVIESFVSKGDYKTDKAMCDESGEYFACSLYDSSSDKDNYKLFVWGKGTEPVEKISSDGMIGIKYISERGRIFFTKTDVITDELGTGNTSLWYFDIETDNARKLEENIDSVDFYLKNETIIIRDKDGGLFVGNINNLSDKKKIADGVSALLLEEKECNNYFKAADAVINSDAGADSLCYKKNNRVYLYDVLSGVSTDIGSVGGSDFSVCYDDVNRIIYLADNKSLTCGVIVDDKINDRKKLDADLAGVDMVWNDPKKTILFLSSDGTLKKAADREVSDVSDKSGIKSLIRVQNDGGYAYVREGAFYYGSAFDKEAVPIGDMSSENITSAVRADGYIYRLEGRKLIATSDDGTYIKDMGECEKLWCVKP